MSIYDTIGYCVDFLGKNARHILAKKELVIFIFSEHEKKKYRNIVECYSYAELIEQLEMNKIASNKTFLYRLKYSNILINQQTRDLITRGHNIILLHSVGHVESEPVFQGSITEIEADYVKCLLDHNITISKGRRIGVGSYGNVYISCLDINGCNRVVKIGKIEEKEIDIHKILADARCAPQIYDQWECDDNTFLVMERLTGTLGDLENLVTYLDAISIVELCAKCDKIGVLREDFHKENIMYKTTVDGIREWYLIDFGLAYYKPNSVSPGSNLSDLINSIEGEYHHGFPDEFIAVLRKNLELARRGKIESE